MALLEGWSYRKSITLSRASGAVTNYQMKLLVGESAGASGEDVDCNSHVQTDFDDLRFTKSDGTTLLDYWIESITGTTPNQLATVWIEFDSIGTGATTFYMYYGKADATAVSSGANTFIVFDNFERGANGDNVGGSWSVLVGAARISTEQKYGGTRSMKVYFVDPYLGRVEIPVTASANISIRFRFYKETLALLLTHHSNGTYAADVKHDAAEDILVYDNYSFVDTGGNCTADAWGLCEINEFDWTNATVDVWHNDVKVGNNFSIAVPDGTYIDAVCFEGSPTAGYDFWIDDFIVRNWRATGPAWGSWGAEEEVAVVGHPTMRRWGGIPGMRLGNRKGW